MSVYTTEGSKVRHLEPTCKALRAEVTALHPEVEGDLAKLDAAVEMTRVRNTGTLRERTTRCKAAGCWGDYAQGERVVATGGTPKPGFPKPKDGAFHAASVLNDGTAAHKAAAKKAAAKAGVSLEERAAAAIARQRNAAS
jgi:hypothetical protein